LDGAARAGGAARPPLKTSGLTDFRFCTLLHTFAHLKLPAAWWQKSTMSPKAKTKDQPEPLDLLTVAETAGVLRCSVSALNKWRGVGKGPRFIYIGAHVRYRRGDIIAYVARQTRASTSAEAPPPTI
jgi:hypothetical protein